MTVTADGGVLFNWSREFTLIFCLSKHLLSELCACFQLGLNFFNEMTLIITLAIPWCLIRAPGYGDHPVMEQVLCLMPLSLWEQNRGLSVFISLVRVS
jgi:hypothetical protein